MPDREKIISDLTSLKEHYAFYESELRTIDNALALLKDDETQLQYRDDHIAMYQAEIKRLEALLKCGIWVSAENVVRCKDCEHCYFASNRIPSEQNYACGKHGFDVTQDWFCADGERK